MKFWVVLIGMSALVQLSTVNAAVSSPAAFSFSKKSAYLQLIRQYEADAASESSVEVFEYGKSIKGRPLKLFWIGKESALVTRPAILVTAAIHGNEYLNVESEIFNWILKQKSKTAALLSYFNSGGVFLMVPVSNPDGFDQKLRANANGVDLNRDWDTPTKNHKGFKEPETASLAAFLKKISEERKLKITVAADYHCCEGAFLYPRSYNLEKLPATDEKNYLHLAKAAQKYLGVRYGRTGELLSYYPLGAAKDYYYDTYGAMSFTFEGREGSERQFLQGHYQFWEHLFAWVVTQKVSKVLSFQFPLNGLKLN